MQNELQRAIEVFARKYGLHRGKRKHRRDGSPYTKRSHGQRRAERRRIEKCAKEARKLNRRK